MRSKTLLLASSVSSGEFDAAQTGVPAPQTSPAPQTACLLRKRVCLRRRLPRRPHLRLNLFRAPQLPPSGPPVRLTVQDAEALALRNNPQISVYRLLAMASQQVTRQEKSNYYPTTSTAA